MLIFLAVISCILCSTANCNNAQNASVTYDETTDSFAIHDSFVENAVAYGNFKDEIFLTGWSYLEVKTVETFPDPVQAYAAGLVEGYLTRDLLAKTWNNNMGNYCLGEDEYCQRLDNFLRENVDYINENVKEKRLQGYSYWHQVALIFEQLNGLEAGYRNQTGKPITQVNTTGFLLLNIMGDLDGLEPALGKKEPDPYKSSSCSALIKILPGFEDIYFAHDTWSTYNMMIRVLKKYDLNFHVTFGGSEVIPGHTAAFSSQPGFLFSLDDFYLLSSGLGATETTIENYNPSLWSLITPRDSILEWQRSLVANRLATSGKGWTDIFSRFNSGTYNNQWMILDFKKFLPGMPLQDGLLRILEQMPGHIHTEDITDVLRNQTYWSSYNIAYFKDIFQVSDAPKMVAKYGDYYTHERSPRGMIFARDQGTVRDIPSMTKIMRYNDFKNDPLSRCSNCTPPYNANMAISSRRDLNPANGTYPFKDLGSGHYGGIDMKLTSGKMFQNYEFVAISGPTFDPLPPFQWSTSDYADEPNHEGQPDLWQFEPIVHQWSQP